jgi:ketosteroid isomerase-like protein
MKSIFSTIVLMFTFAGFAVAQCSNADKTALEAFDRAWGMAGEKGDRAALTAILADDYAGFPAMQTKTASIDATMKTFERNKSNPAMADKISHDNYLITCTPVSATITHRNVITTEDGAGGKRETFWTRSVHFLEKRGGKWQVVSNTGHDMDDSMMLGYMEMDWSNADVKKDVKWFEDNFASDFSSISSQTGKLTSKSEELAGIKTDKGVTDSAVTSDLNIRVDGNSAVVTGVYHTKGRDEKSQAFDRRISFTDTYIKRDGRWQVWASQGTIIP